MPAPRPIAYLTDIEGMLPRLTSFASDNPLVRLDPQGRLVVSPGALFVFGGDAIDRGPDSRRIVALLTEAKRRQPEQVVLLAGNRDINKLRLRRELAGFPQPKTPREVYGDPPRLLQWIFKNTMGASEAFEMRRRELGPASDADVVQSYLQDLLPHGAHAEYLALCQLAFREGRTLFVHGAVTRESLGHVPGCAPLPEVDAWVAGLNAWFRSQIEAYREGRTTNAGEPAWAEVVAYQAPKPGTKLNQGSVVYGRLTDDLQNPHLPEREAVEALLAAGVDRLVVGHTPAGDVPSVLRGHGFELVMADNSHARVETGTRLLLTPEGLDVRGRTVLDAGATPGEALDVAYALRRDQDTRLGLYDADSGHLVKGLLRQGGVVLWKGLPEWRNEQLAVPESDLEHRRLVLPRLGPPPPPPPAPEPAPAPPSGTGPS